MISPTNTAQKRVHWSDEEDKPLETIHRIKRVCIKLVPENVDQVAKYLHLNSGQLSFTKADDLTLMRDYNKLLQECLKLYKVEDDEFRNRMDLFLDQFLNEIHKRGHDSDSDIESI